MQKKLFFLVIFTLLLASMFSISVIADDDARENIDRTNVPGFSFQKFFRSIFMGGRLTGAVISDPACASDVTDHVVLTSNLACSGNAINIGAHNLIIDCQGNTISGDGSGYGVYSSGFSNITIKNCVINNFHTGARFQSGNDHSVLDSDLTGSSYGMVLISSDNVVVDGTPLTGSDAIYLSGADDCVFNDITFTGTSYTIHHAGASARNNFTNSIINGGTYSVRYNVNGGNNGYWNNEFYNTGFSSSGGSDIYCNGVGNYYDSVISGSQVPKTDCGPTPGASNVNVDPTVATSSWSFGGGTPTYKSLQEAYNNVVPSGTINILSGKGPVLENIITAKDGVTLDCNDETIQGTGSGTGIDISSESDNTVQNCVLDNFATGVRSNSGNGNRVLNSDFTSVGTGVVFSNSDNGLVDGTSITSTGDSIYLSGADYNVFSNNVLDSNTYTIHHAGASSYNNFTDNVISGTTYGLRYNVNGGNNWYWRNEFYDAGFSSFGGSDNYCVNGVGNYFSGTVSGDRVPKLDCGPTSGSTVNVDGRVATSSWSFGGGTPTYKSLQEAWNNVKPNGTVNVVSGSGPYVGQAEMISSKDGVTFNCNNQVIQGAGSGRAFFVNGESFNIIQNCNIDNFATGIYSSAGNSNEFLNNDITGVNTGIVLANSDNGLVDGNNVNSNGDSVYLSGADYNIIQDNTLDSNSYTIQHGGASTWNNFTNNHVYGGTYSVRYNVAGGNNWYWLNRFYDTGFSSWASNDVFCVGGVGNEYLNNVPAAQIPPGDCGGVSNDFAPIVDNVTLLASSPLNTSCDDLELYYDLYDQDGNLVRGIVDWRMDNTDVQSAFNGNSIAVLNMPGETEALPVVNDYSTYGNDGTLQGAGVEQAGWEKTGGFDGFSYFNFDGVDDRVDLGTFNELNGVNAFTVSFWIKPNQLPFSGYQGIFARGSTSQRTPWIFGNSGGSNLYLQFETTNTANDCNLVTSNLVQGQWQHVVFRWDGSECTSFIDGVQGASDTTSGGTVLANTDGSNYLGYINGFAYLNGGLDEVLVYDRALSDEQISLLAAGENNISDEETVNFGVEGFDNWQVEVTPWDTKFKGTSELSNVLGISHCLPGDSETPGQGTCDDGIDNDCDCLVDGQDPDCPIELEISLNLNPNPVNVSETVTASGRVQYTNGSFVPNNPVSIFMNNVLFNETSSSPGGPEGIVDLVGGQLSYGTSNPGNVFSTFNANGLTDGSKYSGYSTYLSPWGADGPYIEIDLGESMNVDNVSLFCRQYSNQVYHFVEQADVEVSNDGLVWTYAGTGVSGMTSVQDSDLGHCDLEVNVGTSARYLRVVIQNPTLSTAGEITEVEVYTGAASSGGPDYYTVDTDVNGDYSYQFTAPGISGIYTLKANTSFAGTDTDSIDFLDVQNIIQAGIDADGDGYCECPSCPPAFSCLFSGHDCDDTNISINPGAIEICGDGVDNNCDNLTDYEDTVTCPLVCYGVASYWDFENSLDLGNDIIGNNNGVVSGGSQTCGKVGASVDLDGVDDVVTISDSSSLEFGNAISVSTWVKLDAVETWRGVVAKWGSNSPASWAFFTEASSKFAFYVTSTNSVTGSAFVRWETVPSADTWYHLVGTYDGANIRLYVDGVLVDTTPYTGAIQDNALGIDIGTYGTTNRNHYLDGQVDEVAIFGRALNSTEVSQMYVDSSSDKTYCGNGVAPFECVECDAIDGMTNYWTFNDSLSPGADLFADTNVVLGGTALWTVDGKSGGAIELDGVNDYMTAHGATSNINPSEGTVAFWLKTTADSESGSTGTLFQTRGASGNPLMITETDRIYLSIDGGNNAQYRPYWNVGEWHHITVTYPSAKIYYDGVEVADGTDSTISTTADSLYIGQNAFNGQRVNGTFDEVAIFDRELNSTEVKQIYNSGKGGKSYCELVEPCTIEKARGLMNYNDEVKDVFVYDLTKDSLDYTTWYCNNSASWYSDVKDDEDLALDGTVSFVGTGIRPYYINDDSFGTASTNYPGDQIVLDLGEVKQFDKIRMAFYSQSAQYPSEYAVGVSNDNVSYTWISNVTGNTNAGIEVVPGVTSARYIRVDIVATTAPQVRFNAMQVFNGEYAKCFPIKSYIVAGRYGTHIVDANDCSLFKRFHHTDAVRHSLMAGHSSLQDMETVASNGKIVKMADGTTTNTLIFDFVNDIGRFHYYNGVFKFNRPISGRNLPGAYQSYGGTGTLSKYCGDVVTKDGKFIFNCGLGNPAGTRVYVLDYDANTRTVSLGYTGNLNKQVFVSYDWDILWSNDTHLFRKNNYDQVETAFDYDEIVPMTGITDIAANNKYVFVGTDSGVKKLSLVDLSVIEEYNVSNGLIAGSSNVVSHLNLRGDTLYVGTNSGTDLGGITKIDSVNDSVLYSWTNGVGEELIDYDITSLDIGSMLVGTTAGAQPLEDENASADLDCIGSEDTLELCGNGIDDDCDGNVDLDDLNCEQFVCVSETVLVTGYSDENVVCTGSNCIVQKDLEFCEGEAVGLRVNHNYMTVDCNGHKLIGFNQTGYGVFTSSIGTTIKNCDISEFSQNIYAYNSGDNTLENNTLTNSASYGLYLRGGAPGDSTNNLVKDNTFGPGLQNSIVNGLTLYTLAGGNDIWQGNVFNQSDSRVTLIIRNLTFIDNEIYNMNTANGVYITENDSYVANNVFENSQLSVFGSNSRIYNNSLRYYGIRLFGQNNTVSNNQLYNINQTNTALRYGIRLCGSGASGSRDVKDSVVSGNEIYTSTYQGIVVGGAGCGDLGSNNIITGNYLEDSVDGITTAGAVNNTVITNNTLVDCSSDGIVASGTDNTVTFNEITNCRTGVDAGYATNTITIAENNIVDSSQNGLRLPFTELINTSLYHNNIYNIGVWKAGTFLDDYYIDMQLNGEGNFWGRTNTSEPCFIPGTDSNRLNVTDTSCYWRLDGWLYGCEDADNDSHSAIYCGGDDCDDNNPNVNPSAGENTTVLCQDGLDNDCDGDIDVMDADCNGILSGQDNDGDGYCECPFCPPVYNCIFGGNDCNDANINIYPGAPEICNGIDDNCNNLTDENNGDCTGNTPYCVAETCVQCVDNSDCDDGLWCNGEEYCFEGTCWSGTPQVIDDGVGCTVDSCDEVNDVIVNTADDSLCLDGLWCNGFEYCDATLDCQADMIPPTCDDEIPCTLDSCDEGIDTGDNLGTCVFDTANCECEVDADCDDGNACTDDSCQNLECVNTNNDNNPCDDGFFCTVDDQCFSGVCSGIIAPVSDGISCTVDSCDEDLDMIVHTPNDAFCDNGLYCDGAEVCDVALDCQAGTPPSIDDGVGCTVDSCDEDNDTITHIADDSLCLDGSYCNGAEFCDINLDCQTGSAIVCDDGVTCTVDSCDEGVDTNDNLGSCDFDTSGCECTSDAQCEDNNPCTDDACVAFACVNSANDLNSCDDGFFCTVNDRCSAGSCVSDARDVNDNVGCTLDSCDEDLDLVVHNPLDSACDNGLFCDGSETCDALLDCQAGTPPSIDDGVGCTNDYCDEDTDVITHTADDSLCLDGSYCNGAEFCDATLDCQSGTPPVCDDNILCTINNCDEGTDILDNVGDCVFDNTPCECEVDADCDDNNPCTDDVCNANFECESTNNDANSCDDGFFCTTNDRCEAGSCVADTLNVDDGVGCTVDSCDEVNDVIVNTPNDAVCDDAQYCNGAEVCDALLDCQAGTPPKVDDGVSCTADSCDEFNDIIVHVPENLACDNGLFCDGSETCDALLDCQAGTPPSIDDGVGCTVDSCDEVNDIIVNTVDDSLCLDGLYCNGAEFCDAALDCQLGTAPTCDDNILCTLDACDEGTNLFDNAGTCTVDTTPCECEVDADCDDGNACTDDVCNANLECENNANDANSCDDGFFCTVNDRCSAGSCISDARNVDDLVGCTIDSCDEDNDVLVHTPNDAVCDNSLYCDGMEFCDAALDCQSGTPPNVDDGVSCTLDTCDEATDSITHVADDSVCLDGLYCNGAEFCDAALDCQLGTAPTCDDGILCTSDACDEGLDLFDNVGDCIFDTIGCDCVVDSDCDDNNPCTDDVCNANFECENVNDDSNTCSDDAWCTVNDRCEAGSCISDARNVDDGIDCTQDSCDEIYDEVINNPSNTFCDDGLYCNGAEVCNPVLGCEVGIAPTCDDGLACTLDSCNELTDACNFVAIDNDGDGYDICAGPNQDCDDGDADVHPGAVEVCNGYDDDCNGLVDEGCDACGNNVLEFPEQCDDGNNNNGDGCSDDCVAEQTEEECADNIEVVDNGDGTYDYTLYNGGVPILIIENNQGLIDWQGSLCEREDATTWIFNRIGFSISGLELTGTTKDIILKNKALLCAVDDDEFRSGNLLGEFACFLHPDRIVWSVFNGNACGSPGSPVAGKDRFGSDTGYTCEVMSIGGTNYARLKGFTHTTVISVDDKDADGWSVEEDCDDTDEFVNPGVAETCDGVDNNCDGLVDYEAVVGDLDNSCGEDSCEGTDIYFNYYCDEGVGCATEQVIEDGDNDGFNGLCNDCNDADENTYPGAQEICPDDGIDNNCDGSATFDCEATCDVDGDGYFNSSKWFCFGSDCDDGNALINPGAVEECDDVDNNCDNEIDNRDDDEDDVNDCTDDRCLNTVVPEGVPTNRFNRLLWRHFAEIDGDEIFETRNRIFGPVVDSQYDLVDAHGCSCEQILECKPGKNRGEYKFGCSRGTMRVWINQWAWAPDCQRQTRWGRKVLDDGDPKDEDEDTDGDGIRDDEDEDDDNDGVRDEDDEEPESKPDPVTNEPSGKPRWWCRRTGRC